MKLSEILYDSVKEIWNSYNEHPFVKGIEECNLSLEKFKYYMIQDYLYLLDYSKIFALGVVKAPDEETMRFFADLVNSTLNSEMDIHKKYMERLHITFEEVKGKKSGKTRTKSIDCQGFGLITSHSYDKKGEEQEVPYMIAPVYQDSEDWIYLIELDFSGSSFSMIPRICRHLKNDGGLPGEAGTHFRWGAGVCITSDSKLKILATSRNIVSTGVTKLNTNYWETE